MRTPLRLMVATIAASTMLAGFATSAVAKSDTIKDKRADVLQFDDFEDEDGIQLNRTDSIDSGVDVTSMKVNHSKKNLTVTIKVASLAKNDTFASLEVWVKGKKKSQALNVMSESRKRVEVYDHRFEKLCNAKQSYKSGKNGKITITISRKCLGKPKSVRVQGGLVQWHMFDDENFNAYIDPISSKRVNDSTWTSWIKSS